VELATGVAGPYVGRVFADMGARVVKVEPVTGDPIRREQPLVGDESAFFNWLNTGKQSSRMVLEDPRVEELAREAHVIVHAERGAVADDLEARLKAANPSAVIVSLSPYGRSGERAVWKASPLTEWATGGYHYFGGAPDREPIALPGYQAEFHAGMHAAVGALATLWHVREGGEGQVVELSHQEAVLSDHSWLVSSWTHQGKVQGRTGSLYAKCSDGFIFLFNLVPYTNLFVLMERFDLLEDESLQQPAEWWARWPEVFAAFEQWAATRTKQEIYHACQELRIAASPVNTMADVAESVQLAAREWFGTVEAGGGTVVGPGLPFPVLKGGGRPTAQPTPPLPRSRERGRGEGGTLPWRAAGHRGHRELGGPDRRKAPGRPRGGRDQGRAGNEAGHPRARVRRGRHVARALQPQRLLQQDEPQQAGRLPGPGDSGGPRRVPADGGQRGCGAGEQRRPCHESAWHRLRNAARHQPGARDVLDVGLRATGPERNYSAYGSNIETTSGLASLLGYDDTKFYGTGTFYADPITGTHGSIAILAALHGRRRTARANGSTWPSWKPWRRSSRNSSWNTR
jgi:crotonobetainyl-CoA:carnitine CoA-transferase CaiB-like acyl-CoA transferase